MIYRKKLIGIAFGIFNSLGYGLSGKIYQKALKVKLNEVKIAFSREKYCRINLNGVFVGKYYLDFLIENIFAVELKVKNEKYQEHINQILNYLKAENLKLGLLIVMSKKGVLIKRVIN